MRIVIRNKPEKGFKLLEKYSAVLKRDLFLGNESDTPLYVKVQRKRKKKTHD